MSDNAITTLRLSPELRVEILEHLIREAPNEGVGILAVEARTDVATAVAFFPGENVDASPHRFTMHPRAVFGALETIEECGWQLGAIVHSHLRGPARPSRTDIGEAHYPEALMLIASLAVMPPEMRVWRMDSTDDEDVMRPVILDTRLSSSKRTCANSSSVQA